MMTPDSKTIYFYTMYGQLVQSIERIRQWLWQNIDQEKTWQGKSVHILYLENIDCVVLCYTAQVYKPTRYPIWLWRTKNRGFQTLQTPGCTQYRYYWCWGQSHDILKGPLKYRCRTQARRHHYYCSQIPNALDIAKSSVCTHIDTYLYLHIWVTHTFGLPVGDRVTLFVIVASNLRYKAHSDSHIVCDVIFLKHNRYIVSHHS